MGKFSGVLFYTDYDDTLYNTAHTVSPENRAAIRYFIRNGGRFSIATGRAHRTFTPQIQQEELELNAPVVLSNGAMLYDYQADRCLVESHLDGDAPERLAQLCRVFPDLAVEAYHGEEIYVHNPNAVTTAHLTKVGGVQIPCPIGSMPTPWIKVLLEQDHPYLLAVQAHLLRCWGDSFEAIFSNPYLLELTAKGCHKGSMAARAAQLLHIDPRHFYCMGDNQNDLPMLKLSAIPFAPANCAPEVRGWLAARGRAPLGHCDEHAVAQAIGILDSLY